MSKGKISAAVLGEIIGTGIIGAIAFVSGDDLHNGAGGPVMVILRAVLYRRNVIGGSIAYVFLKALSANKMLGKIQASLGAKVYDKSKS